MCPLRLLPSALILLATALPAFAAPPSAGDEFFESRIRPLLVEKCQSCHGPERHSSGLRLDSRASALKGGERGPAIVPADVEKSLLLQAVRHTGELKMPREKLPQESIDALTAWVKMGAPWPEGGTAPVKPVTVADVRKSHWSFQPPKDHAPPAVKDATWPRTDVDRFILAKLEEKGLAPRPDADRRTLLRRVTFDLLGLPPTPEEIDEFVNDKSPDAFVRVVDRLLASPAYGERWGRHWLDVARYADSKGYVFQEERRYPFAYTYRDYVIRAFNEDLAYDRFLIEQLAADKLELKEDKRPLAAMGFLTLGRRFLNNKADIIDDRIDTVARGLMGLTVGCARCHDHKFDPIPQKDYYSLYGVFASSEEPKDLPTIASPAETEQAKAFEKELAALEKEVADYEEKHRDEIKSGNRLHRDELRKRRRKVEALKASHPGAPASAMVLVDAPRPVDPVVFLRGNPGNRGPAVPRQFLEVLSPDKREPFKDGSGRLELAKAIASRDNPLTARVMVNRVWTLHFGQGLVRTPGDFGIRGEPPTHPELLDWLTTRFVTEGWSVKKLHRTILLSRVYQQGSDLDPKAQTIDPDNRLVWRMNRRRLDFEQTRDSLLFVSGKLDRTIGGKAVDITRAPFSTRRTVYGFIDRQNLPGLFRTFDFASPDTSTPQRDVTTVPQQALFLMNSPFVVEQAKALANRPDVAAKDGAERVKLLYRILFGRNPDREEAELAREFLASAKTEKVIGLTPWEKYAQVLLLSNEFGFID